MAPKAKSRDKVRDKTGKPSASHRGGSAQSAGRTQHAKAMDSTAAADSLAASVVSSILGVSAERGPAQHGASHRHAKQARLDSRLSAVESSVSELLHRVSDVSRRIERMEAIMFFYDSDHYKHMDDKLRSLLTTHETPPHTGNLVRVQPEAVTFHDRSSSKVDQPLVDQTVKAPILPGPVRHVSSSPACSPASCEKVRPSGGRALRKHSRDVRRARLRKPSREALGVLESHAQAPERRREPLPQRSDWLLCASARSYKMKKYFFRRSVPCEGCQGSGVTISRNVFGNQTCILCLGTGKHVPKG